jgi:hypothetical protein
MQRSISQHVASSGPSRRRSLPPSPSLVVSQSVNQRWRERPRCFALPLTPRSRRGRSRHRWCAEVNVCTHSVMRDERAAGMCVGFAGATRPMDRTTIGSCARHVFPEGTPCVRTQIVAAHHRVRARPVPCSAPSMLFAALRPGRRPGLRALTTPPRGTGLALTRWWLPYRSLQRFLTKESRGRMVVSSRQCRTALPLFASNGARIRSAPTGHDIERNPQHIAVRCTTASPAGTMDCKSRGLSRRIILRMTRRAEMASPTASVMPWSD